MKISEFRKFLEKSRLGLPLAFLIFFASCAQVDSLNPRVDNDFAEAVGDATVSDMDVFQGVVFLDGKVGDKLSNFNSFNIANMLSDEAQIQRVRDMHQQVMQVLVASDENYLSNFRTEITSGQYYRVQAAMKQTSNDVVKVMAQLSDQSVASLLEKGNTFLAALSDDQEVTSAMNQDDLAQALKEIEIDVWLWAEVAAVAVVVVVVLWVLLINDSGNDTFLMEEFLSTVTLELESNPINQ